MLSLDLGPLRYPAAFVIALVLALYFTPLIRGAAIRYGVVDVPDTKLKQHKQPTPYLGGIAVYLSFLFALAFTYDFDAQILGILLSASIVVMLGLFDDLKVLSPRVKLAGQLVAALVLVKCGVMIRLHFLPDWAALGLTVLWLVGVTNALNLIDVSDGLASGVASIAGMFLYVVALWNGDTQIAMMTLALVGSAIGFLAFNRAPAKIFLGDAGSMFLGFMLAALAMRGHYTFKHTLAAVSPAVILGVPIFDTLFVMAARAARGIPLMRGSPDHFAVRLRNHGYRAGPIALVGYLAGAALGCAALVLCVAPLPIASMVLGGVVVAAIAAALVLKRMGRSPAERTRSAEVPPPATPKSEEELRGNP